MNLAFSPRLRAFFIHLSLSGLLALAAIFLVFSVWYPSPLHSAVGVTEIFPVLLGVDAILGPCLTLLVYKTGKKSLPFDLATIVILQAVAFGYGLSTVAGGRPAFMVFNVDHFDLVQAYQVDQRRLAEAFPEFSQISYSGPIWASTKDDFTPDERKANLQEAVVAGIFVFERPEFYRPLAKAGESFRKSTKPLAALNRSNDPVLVKQQLAQWPDADAFLPMNARVHPVTVLVNRSSARVVAIVDLNPF